MPYREFVDSCLVEWTVWYVAASRSERRECDSRRTVERPKPDRRRRTDPRPLRMRVSAPMSRGWLCFENAAEKRRLMPVPPNWQRMSERQLEEHCARAAVVAKTVRKCVARPRGVVAAEARSGERHRGIPRGGSWRTAS
jgi:hypothetical protein